MRSLLIALLALTSGVALAAPSLTTPPSAAAGSTITFKATGTGNPREFVTVVPKGAREGAYFAYVYVTGAGDLKLAMPATPGDYELRLCAADSPYKTLVAKPIQLLGASASVSAPASVAAGAPFEVKWTGPNNERDYIAIGETTPGGRLYLDYKYSRDGSPVKLAAPEKPGNYEVRYILGVGDTVIARQPITVGGVTAIGDGACPGRRRREIQGDLDRPEQSTRLRHHGQGRHERANLRALRVHQQGQHAGIHRAGCSRRVRDPLRHGQDVQHAGPRADHGGAITGTVAGPAQAVAGETFKATWKGPDNARNFVTIVPKGAREGAYSGSYFYTTPQNNPGNLVAPLVPGEYELRYSTAEQYVTLARAAITITPAKNEPGKVAVTLAAGAKSGGAIEIILDASGSMLQKLGAERRIDIAKRTLTKLISSTIPAGTPFAFRVFGREVDSCQTDLDVPVAPLEPRCRRPAHRRAGRQERRQDADRRLARQGRGRPQERHGREAHRAGHRWRRNLRRRSRRGHRAPAQGGHRHSRQHRRLRARRREAGHHLPSLVGCRRRRVLRCQGCCRASTSR